MKEKLIVLLGDKKKVRNLYKEASKVPQMFYLINEKQLLDNCDSIRGKLVANLSIKFFKQHEEFLTNKFEVIVINDVPANIKKAVMKLIQEFYIIPKDRGKLTIHVIAEGEEK